MNGDNNKPLLEMISLRDYFAAHAPPMDQQWWDDMRSDSGIVYREQALSDWAYTYADAMLAERAK